MTAQRRRRRKGPAPDKAQAIADPKKPKHGDPDYVPSLYDMLDGTAPSGTAGGVDMGGKFTG